MKSDARVALEFLCVAVVPIGGLLCGCGGSLDVSTHSGDASHLSDASQGGVGPEDAAQSSGDACSVVLASDYDQSCAVDTDCVAVGQVSACPPGPGDRCAEWSVSRTALPQYMTALSSALNSVPTGTTCLGEISPCCLQGQCTMSSCSESPPNPPAGTDASTDAQVIPPGSVLCSSELGPVDAGVLDAGSVTWCIPPQSCMPYNGSWACCMNVGGGVVTCKTS
jgi:hypothetical protein